MNIHWKVSVTKLDKVNIQVQLDNKLKNGLKVKKQNSIYETGSSENSIPYLPEISPFKCSSSSFKNRARQ